MKNFEISYIPKEGGSYATVEHGVNNMIQAVREMVKDGCKHITIKEIPKR